MWRTVATVVIVVFSIVLGQIVLSPPLEQTEQTLNETGDYNNSHFDGNERITSILNSWYLMGLVGIAGICSWGVWRLIRRERTRGRGGV